MINKKALRKTISIECTECRKRPTNVTTKGISIYNTCKNTKNFPLKLETKKFCRYCQTHTVHKEV